MKRLFFLPLLATMIAVHAQDIKEGETLQEVTVKGSKVVQRVDGQTIYPTRQQLESSTNGYSLLKREHPDFFRVQRGLKIGGQTFSAIGNRFLLSRPWKIQVQCSRRMTDQQIEEKSTSF